MTIQKLNEIFKEIKKEKENLIKLHQESKCHYCIEYDFGREENWCHECCVDEACIKDHSDFAD